HPLSLHDALPIWFCSGPFSPAQLLRAWIRGAKTLALGLRWQLAALPPLIAPPWPPSDRSAPLAFVWFAFRHSLDSQPGGQRGRQRSPELLGAGKPISLQSF